MRIGVFYESMYGNTEAIARAVADGLRSGGEVTLEPMPSNLPEGLDLVVLGAPTHGLSMPTEGSRRSGNRGRTRRPTGESVREAIARMPSGRSTHFAVFDTRFGKPRWLTGSAARAMARRLRSRGFDVVADPESFFVAGTEGPLEDGELARATSWGASLATRTTRPVSTQPTR